MKSSTKFLVYCLLLMLVQQASFAQNRKRVVDSLNKLLQNATQDSTRLRLYLKLGDACDMKDNLKYAEPAIKLADKLISQATDTNEKKKFLKEKGRAYVYFLAFYHDGISLTKEAEYLQKQLAVYREINDTIDILSTLSDIIDNYKSQGDFYQAFVTCQQGLELSQQSNRKKGIAHFLRQMGDVFEAQGDTVQALENYQKTLAITYQGKDNRSIALALTAVAKGYKHNVSQALTYFSKAVQIYEKLKDTNAVSKTYRFIGDMYMQDNDLPNALENYNKSLALSGEHPGGWDGIDLLINTGRIYCMQGDVQHALYYHTQALKESQALNDVPRITNTYYRLAQDYMQQKDLAKAKKYSDMSLSITTQNSFADNVRDIEWFAVQIDSATGNYKEAFIRYRQYIALNNKLHSEEVRKAAMKEKFLEQYTKQKAIDQAVQAQKDAEAEAAKQKQKRIAEAVGVGLLLSLAFAGFIFRSLKITRKQKQDIENKNKVIEEKNRDILDSITYAKRLQDAILPPLSIIKQFLPESFVLYKPKDIVAGDFYWLERAGDSMLFAAADCTGHGVPGALVSVVCSNALNRTVKEFKITEPGKILDKVRELVLETFEKSEDNVQDGMDISLAAISYQPLAISWSGAYNSLWYVQNGEIKEIAADKQPIGKVDKPSPFNTHRLNLQKGDTLYLFTDGYADQFGGEKGKKFKYKQLQEKLLAISHRSMAEQKQILETILEEWKGNLEQVDDILIIGIRV